MPSPAGSNSMIWLVLVYRLPSQPPSLRSLVRRKLTAAGAIYLSRACAAAPAGPAERVMRTVRASIAVAGGSAVLLRARALSGGTEIYAAFNEARDREYETIAVGSRSAAQAIEAVIANGDFTLGHLSDNDATLKRQEAATARSPVSISLVPRRPALPGRLWRGTGRSSISTAGTWTPRTTDPDTSAACFAFCELGIRLQAQRRRGSPSNADTPPTVPARSNGGGCAA